MAFVADDLGAWLVGLLADAGRKKLTVWALGTEQDRALRQAASAAVWLTARDLRPEGGERTEELALVITHVFGGTVPEALAGSGTTVLENLWTGIGSRFAVLDDVSLTGTGQSSAQNLGLTTATLAEVLFGHLVREIVTSGSRGGALEPLAAQLNHDMTHLQVQRLEYVTGQLSEQLDRALLSQVRVDQAPPSAALEAKYSLPPDTAVFTGRNDELDRIATAATDAAAVGGVVTIQAIDGMPGVGKTALAVHAAHLLRHQFPDGQLFIDLYAHTPGREPVLPATALAGLLSAIGLDARYLPEDLDNRARLWRDRMTGRRVLLVLDNVSSTTQVTPLLPDSDCCLVLITSRRHLGDLPGGTTLGMLLGVLPPDEAQEMFNRLAPRSVFAQSGTVRELVQLAGYLPLAISLLARVYQKHKVWSLGDLIAETRTSMLTLSAEAVTVASAFDISYQHLASDQKRFFRRLGLHPGSTIDAHAAANLAGIPMHKAVYCLDSLHREGLLIEVSHRRYGMHDLIRHYAQVLAANDRAWSREHALGRLLDYYQYIAAISESFIAGQYETGYHQIIPVRPPAVAFELHDRELALSWARTERANLIACIDHATQTDQLERIVALTAAIAALMRLDGPWADAIVRHVSAVDAARRLRDRPSEARALSNLGVVQRLTDDFPGAVDSLEASLNIFSELGYRLGQANALGELGVVRRMTGDYHGASDALETALRIFSELGDRQSQANASSNLAAIRRLAGDYPGAVDALETALSIFDELGDRLGRANTLSYLGVMRRQTGDYPGAVEALESALDVCRDIGSRVTEANTIRDLGVVRRMTGDYHGASDALETALRIFSELSDRLGQANTLSELGNVRRLTGDFLSAGNALESALEIYREIGNLGGVVETLNDIGALHRVGGELHHAEECHSQALDLAVEIRSSWDEAHAHAGLGRCALADGRIAEAVARLQNALEIFRKLGAAEASGISAELNSIHR